MTALSCGPPPLSNITDVKQVLPNLFVHPNLMCSAFICLLKLLLVLPAAEGPLHLQNSTLLCNASLTLPTFWICFQLLLISTQPIPCVGLPTPTVDVLQDTFTSALQRASLACISFPLGASLTQYHINLLFPACSVFQVFGYSSIPSITRFPSTLLFGF